MEEPAGPRAIVTGHGDFPAGAVSAVAQITGRGDRLIAFSNAGLGREQIEAELRAHIAEHNVRVVFTDLPGGSATLATRRVMHDDPSITLVTGVNLAALIDFVFCDPSLSPADAAAHAMERGRAAMSVVAGR